MTVSDAPGTLRVHFGEENDTLVIALESVFIQHTGIQFWHREGMLFM